MRLVIALVALLWSMHASADAHEEALQQAKEYFRKGTLLYESNRFEEAAAAYKEAFTLSDRPGFLFNIAQAYRLAGKSQEAITFYGVFIRRVPDAPQRGEAERYIAALSKRIGETPAPARPEPNAKAADTNVPPKIAGPEQPIAPEHATAPTPASNVVAPPPRKPKRWIWGVVGGAIAVVGLSVGLGVGLGLRPRDPTVDGRDTFH